MNNHLEAGIVELVEEFISSGKPCSSYLSIAERRASYIAGNALAGESPLEVTEFTDMVDGIPVKIYRPELGEGLPVVLYFHGGCFISGGFATHDIQLRQIAKAADAIVICIQYRLAPEYIYPAAHDDVYTVASGLNSRISTLGGDPNRVIFMGDSAGAQLALATSLRLVKNGLPIPAKQILLYPMLDPLGQSASYQQNGTDYIITAKMLLSGFSLYAGEGKCADNIDELNLLKNHDYKGLPATVIVTAECDPLRDEGETLYRQMLSSGVEVHCERYLGVIHGFFQLGGVSSSARRCMQMVVNEIVASH
ncbi:alpha/beta hydrolase [Vibrio tritonius]|uniref:Alpha/beta hydrolase n=1 Tax=Vibrio tritonius TaxID=1435069 RepID=A0ABS7YG24_9VIBR|nr:alpha/beta hydrolase [Vibrio tritonius]MCA2014609.1 alpha/beta hydrolase [Vibrio tritonius]